MEGFSWIVTAVIATILSMVIGNLGDKVTSLEPTVIKYIEQNPKDITALDSYCTNYNSLTAHKKFYYTNCGDK